jgi:hypothetical protein
MFEGFDKIVLGVSASFVASLAMFSLLGGFILKMLLDSMI